MQYDIYGRPIVVVNPGSPKASGYHPMVNPPGSYTSPALTGVNFTDNTNQGILANPGAGRRSNTQLAVQRPDLSISPYEMAMRVGGAGLEGAQKSGLQSYANMLNTYGAIQDQQRTNDLAEFNADLKLIPEEADEEPAKGMPQQSPYTKATLDAIQQIENNVARGKSTWFNVFDNVTGLWGGGLSLIPGTPAYDTKMQIETVVSSIGFDRLQKMRDESPTGGALGQVSERELSQLNASLGNLRQSQSRDSFLRNLAQVKRHYLSTVEAIRQQQIAYAKQNGLPVPAAPTAAPGASATGSNLSAADAIVGFTN